MDLFHCHRTSEAMKGEARQGKVSQCDGKVPIIFTQTWTRPPRRLPIPDPGPVFWGFSREGLHPPSFVEVFPDRVLGGVRCAAALAFEGETDLLAMGQEIIKERAFCPCGALLLD